MHKLFLTLRKSGSALRKGDWKLVVHYEDKGEELFNLRLDTSEINNISARNAEKVNELRKILNEKLAESNTKFPEVNPDFDPRD